MRTLIIALLIPLTLGAKIPSVDLHNAAKPGLQMPVIGIGTCGYAISPNEKAELWNNSIAEKAILAWLNLGGRRIDTSLDYLDQPGIGRGIRSQTAVPREEIFITSKVGGGPLGYNETLDQLTTILAQLNTSYVDLLLIHWPLPVWSNSRDPACQHESQARACRQSSWRAMEEIFHSGRALAVGVSNFEISHLQDIVDMKSLLPAVNQVEYHPYWHEDDLVAYCRDKSIVFNTYSPLGTPDWGPDHRGWNSSILDLPLIRDIACRHAKSPAQVLLRWALEKKLVLNPRSWNEKHMAENLDIFDFELTSDEARQIDDVPKPANPKVCPYPSNK